MSRQSSPFEDSGEIIFHQKSREIEEMSRDEIHSPTASSPKVSSAPKCSENTNELLLRAIEAMNRDVASVKQNLGEIFHKQNSFGEQLCEIKNDSRDLRERLISLENNRNPINPSQTKFLGAGERHFTFDRTPITDRNENRVRLHPPITKPTVSIKPQIYGGEEDFEEYLSQFQVLVDLHGWDYHTKSLYLASSLAGNARGVLGELTPTQMRDFDSLVKFLNMRFGSVERSEMFRARLKNRVRGENESMSELAQSIKKLIRQAYPSADSNLTNILALDHFIDALPDQDMRLRIRESQAKDINDAEIIAIRLETHKMADAQRGKVVNAITSTQSPPPDKEDIVISLLKEIKESLKPKPQNQRPYWENKNPNNKKSNGKERYSYKNGSNPEWSNRRCNDYGTQNQNWLNDQASDSRGGSRRPEGISPINHNQ